MEAAVQDNKMAAEASEKVELFFDEKRGRGVRATIFIEPETVLLIENPYILTLEEDCRRNRCNYCCKEREKLRACGGCKFVYYCDRQCQASNYSDHQYECKYLKSFSTECEIRTRTRTLLMAIQKQLKTQKKRSRNVNTHNAQGFPLTPEGLYMRKEGPLSNEQSISEPDVDRLWEFVEAKGLPIKTDLFTKFQRILNVNIFSVRDNQQATRTIIGEGIYTRVSMFNHNCRPNCVFVSNGRQLRIASIRPISPGEECTVSYLNLMAPTRTRRRKLEWYDFDCDCKRCLQDVEKDRLMYAIKCPQMNCRGSVLPWKPSNSLNDRYLACDACGFDINDTRVADNIKQTEIEVKEFLSRKNDYDYLGQYLKECGPILERLDTVFRPYHRRVYQVVKTAFKIAQKLDEAETSLLYGKRCLVALRTHLDVCDTLLGANLWLVGQLQAQLRMNVNAIYTLQEALPTLKIAYGSQHVVTVQAQELLATLTSLEKDALEKSSDDSKNRVTQGLNVQE